MEPQSYGLIGIGAGLLAFMRGLHLVLTAQAGQGDLGIIGLALLVIGGFVFGCGLVAAAISARK
jgi:hypothetical protein